MRQLMRYVVAGLLIVAVCPLQARDDEELELPSKVQSLRDTLAEIDQAMYQREEAYAESQRGSDLNKLNKIREKRKELAADLAAAVRDALSKPEAQLAKQKAALDKLWDRMDKAGDKESKAAKIQEEIDELQDEMAATQAIITAFRKAATPPPYVPPKVTKSKSDNDDDKDDKDEPPAKAKRVYLAQLDGGPGIGYHCYYEGKDFKAYVDKDGGLIVQVYDGKKKLGNEMRVGGMAAYWVDRRQPKNPKHVPRYLVELAEDYEPTDRPRKKLIFEGVLEDDVKFKRTYNFEDTEITVTTGYECHNTTRPSIVHMGFHHSACIGFKPEVPQAERQKALTGYFVKMRDFNGDSRGSWLTFDYWDNKRFPGSTNWIQAFGPWQDLHVILKSKDPILHPRMYAEFCPYQGYSAYIGVANDTLRSYDYRFTIEIRED